MPENNANVEDAWASFWYQDVLFVFFGVPECVAKVPRLSLGVWDLCLLHAAFPFQRGSLSDVFK